MVSRFLGAGLGFLAFAVAAIAGLAVHNPIDVALSRAILGLVVFYAMGRLLGGAIELVVAEHVEMRRKVASTASEAPSPLPSKGAEPPVAEHARKVRSP